MTIERLQELVPVLKRESDNAELKKFRGKIIKFFSIYSQSFQLSKSLRKSGLDRSTFYKYYRSSEWFAEIYDEIEFSTVEKVEQALLKNALNGHFGAQKFILQSKLPQIYGNDKGVQEVKEFMNSVQTGSLESAKEGLEKLVNPELAEDVEVVEEKKEMDK